MGVTGNAESRCLVDALIAVTGSEALATARRRSYAAQWRADMAACGLWLQVADAIRAAQAPDGYRATSAVRTTTAPCRKSP